MAGKQIIKGTVTSAGETIQVRDVAERIAQLQPDAAPLLTFLNSLKRKKETYATKFEWFEDDLVGNTIVDASGAGTGTSITVSAADGLKIANGDILIAPNGESMRVTDGQGTTTLTVVRALGTTPAAFTLVSGDQLIVAGNAIDEGGTTPIYRFVTKTPKSNYIQIFRDAVKITTTQDAIKVYGEADRTYERKKKAIEHKRGIENALLFGNASETAGASDGYIRTTRGLFNSIASNVLDAGGVLVESDFEYFLRSLFRYQASTGPVNKILLCSPIMISALNFWAKQALQVRQDEKVYGMRVSTYRSGHGDLEFVRHWLLGDYSTGASTGVAWNQFSFAIDPSQLTYRFLNGLDTKMHTDIGPKTEEYVLDEYRTHAGFQCMLEKTHGLIKGVTGFAA